MSIYKKGNKYYCRFQINGERHNFLCNGATNKKEAEQLENAFKYKIQQQQNGIMPKDTKKVTIKDIINLYTEHNDNNNRQKRQKEKEVAIKEFFGQNKDVRKILASDILDFRRWLKTKKGLSNGTINRYYSYLSKAYNLAIQNKLIKDNPCKGIKLLEEPKETIKFYTKEERERLIKSAETNMPEFKPFIVCAFQTGLRISNIQYMLWEWIDTEQRIIEIQPQNNKGKKLIRIYISDILLDELKKIGIKKEGWVFVNPNTNNVWINPCRYLKKLCEYAEIKYIGFHGIRHSVGTELARKGMPINVIQALLAHTDIRTTMKYVHITDNAIKDAINILNS